MSGLCKQLLVPADCRKNTILKKTETKPKNQIFFQQLGLQKGWKYLGSRNPKTYGTGKEMKMLLL